MADSRLRDEGNNRSPAAKSSRDVTGDRTSATKRKLSIAEQLTQDALPDIPLIEGFHTCWLSKTNTYDSIMKRERLGYQPVKPEDVTGWEFAVQASNQAGTPGLITWNEMVAYKIPLETYQEIMEFCHHDQPLQSEEAIYASYEELMVDKRGKSLMRDVGNGTEELGSQTVRRPVFPA